ncbi:CLUMA_CG017674, isoform A [Clunio marinus]|uniref:CLUMA_CG017674, isoform A n=1 Tax=Clunio marinus TaxID=568069 RepID=A0A1J1IZK9_9DIPT|nr:CLUMA_CG017674, isoform A [Clunio marinus]
MTRSASLSSHEKLSIYTSNESAVLQELSQAVTKIVKSLEGDKPSATHIIKVTTHKADAKSIDPFIETIATTANVLLIVSKIMSNRKMEKILLSCSGTSQQKFLIVLLKPFGNSIKLMLDIMWRKFILNVHVVTLEANGDVALYTYFPFTKDFCGQVHPVVWNIYRNGAFVTQREHFPRKDKNFFRCTLDVAVFNVPPFTLFINESTNFDVSGVDGNLIKVLSVELNFTINWIIVSDDLRWGEIYANYSSTGATNLVMNRKVDLSIGMWSRTSRRTKALSFSSITYAQGGLILIVPPGAEISSFSKLLQPFNPSVWYFVIATLFIVVIATIFLNYSPRKVKDFVFGKHIRTPFLNIIIVMIGSPMHHVPGRNFSRWILTLFILMWLIIRNLYQAVLYKELQSSERNRHVESLEEMIRQGFHYYMIAPTIENIIHLPEVYERRIIVSRVESDLIVRGKFNDPTVKAGFVAGFHTLLYINKVNLYGFHLNFCKEPLLLRQFGIVFPMNSFLVSSFDEKLIILVENGLIEYWLMENTESDGFALPEVREPMKLTLNHLLSAYQVLGLGLSLATTTFGFELIVRRINFLQKCL